MGGTAQPRLAISQTHEDLYQTPTTSGVGLDSRLISYRDNNVIGTTKRPVYGRRQSCVKEERWRALSV
jgi:hypothetical protein